MTFDKLSDDRVLMTMTKAEMAYLMVIIGRTSQADREHWVKTEVKRHAYYEPALQALTTATRRPNDPGSEFWTAGREALRDGE